MSRNSFDVFNYRLNLHKQITKDATLDAYTMSSKAKLVFNTYMQRVKSQYKLDSGGVKNAILFSYLHNPLNFDDLKQYGKILYIENSIPHYLFWRQNSKVAIELYGEEAAIIETMPRRSSADRQLQ